jgi:hypothetical protein
MERPTLHDKELEVLGQIGVYRDRLIELLKK